MDYNADERVSPSQAIAAATAERHGIQTPANIAAVLRFKKEIADRNQHIPSSRSASLDTYTASSSTVHQRRACASRSPSPELRAIPNFVFVKQNEEYRKLKAKATRRAQQDAMKSEFARLREEGAIGEPQQAVGLHLTRPMCGTRQFDRHFNIRNNPEFDEYDPPSCVPMEHVIPQRIHPHISRKEERAKKRKERLAAQSSSTLPEPTQAQERPHSR